MKKVILTCLSLIWVISLLAQKEVRLKENFDFDWNFSLSLHFPQKLSGSH